VADCRGTIDSKLDLAEITEFEKRYDYIRTYAVEVLGNE